jgi:WS/DGAT/MGAT family acyltransferase
MHHALADGLRSVGLALSVFDDPRNPLRHEQAPAPAAVLDAPGRGLVSGLAGAVSGLLAPALRVLDPHTTLDELGRHAAQARDAAGIAASILQTLVRPTPSTPLNVNVGPGRRFAMLRADADDVKKIRKVHGGTANDVVLTAVAGALRHWLMERGYPLHSPLRALVPVNRARQDPLDTAGNRLSGYLLDLPIDEPNPVARLHSVRAAMIAHKTAGLTRGAGAFPLLADLLPSLLHRLAAPLATPLVGPTSSRLFNTVITNVPLPNMPLTLGGARLTEIYPVIPLAPGQALGVAVSTYQRIVHIGLHADHATMPDLDQLGDGLALAFAELVGSRATV